MNVSIGPFRNPSGDSVQIICSTLMLGPSQMLFDLRRSGKTEVALVVVGKKTVFQDIFVTFTIKIKSSDRVRHHPARHTDTPVVGQPTAGSPVRVCDQDPFLSHVSAVFPSVKTASQHEKYLHSSVFL